MKLTVVLLFSLIMLASCGASPASRTAAGWVQATGVQTTGVQATGGQAGAAQAAGVPAVGNPIVAPVLPKKLDHAALARLMSDPASRVLVLDVRTREEFGAGHIPGAVLAPYDSLGASFAEADKGRPIVVYCRSGRRSAIAAETLASMGYGNVSDFGAIDKWRAGLEY